MKLERIPFKKIRSFYEAGLSAPLVLERSDALTPWELYQRIYPKGPHSFFLDSQRYLPPAQRYSYLGWKPYLRASYKLGARRASSLLVLEGEINRTIRRPNLLAELRKLFRKVRIPQDFSSDFFMGGAVGYWGYELAQEFDRISFRPKPGPSFPALALLFFRGLIVFDHKEERYYLISWLVPQKGIPFLQAFDRAEERLAEMEKLFSSSNGHSPDEDFRLIRFRPEISKSVFEKMVQRTQAYIRSGDIYQANLSQRFSFTFEGSPLRLYDRLRETNPAPYSGVLHFDDLFIASSSPELLVEKKGEICVTCPMAGTRPRGRSPHETVRLERELLRNEKERAEHLMLVDLERNDLGRVSQWRSVRVKDFMRLEKYARVIHIVSKVLGRLRPTKDAWDLIKAMFPGGTITGCPKIRSMEIIDELEPVQRGIYTGSLGYVGFDGNAMLNIAIRTLVLLRNQGYLQVGAGIVADSDPEREYEETLAKGEALAEALVEASV